MREGWLLVMQDMRCLKALYEGADETHQECVDAEEELNNFKNEDL